MIFFKFNYIVQQVGVPAYLKAQAFSC